MQDEVGMCFVVGSARLCIIIHLRKSSESKVSGHDVSLAKFELLASVSCR